MPLFIITRRTKKAIPNRPLSFKAASSPGQICSDEADWDPGPSGHPQPRVASTLHREARAVQSVREPRGVTAPEPRPETPAGGSHAGTRDPTGGTRENHPDSDRRQRPGGREALGPEGQDRDHRATPSSTPASGTGTAPDSRPPGRTPAVGQPPRHRSPPRGHRPVSETQAGLQTDPPPAREGASHPGLNRAPAPSGRQRQLGSEAKQGHDPGGPDSRAPQTPGDRMPAVGAGLPQRCAVRLPPPRARADGPSGVTRGRLGPKAVPSAAGRPAPRQTRRPAPPWPPEPPRRAPGSAAFKHGDLPVCRAVPGQGCPTRGPGSHPFPTHAALSIGEAGRPATALVTREAC